MIPCADRQQEASEHLGHHLGVAGLPDRHAGRQVTSGRCRQCLLDQRAQRIRALHVGLYGDANGAVVAVDGARPLIEFDIGDGSQWHGRPRSWQAPSGFRAGRSRPSRYRATGRGSGFDGPSALNLARFNPMSPIVPTLTVSAIASVETPRSAAVPSSRTNADFGAVERCRRHHRDKFRDRRHVALQARGTLGDHIGVRTADDQRQVPLAAFAELPGHECPAPGR